jgi:predicted phage terminase large subunit-like protein
MTLQKQKLDEWLNQVSYSELNSSDYLPSEFALTFMNFIKLVNGEEGESHKTPPVHLKMLDKVISPNKYIANLCFRGAAKTTLFMEYLVLFIAMFGHLPGLGKVTGMIYVSDSMDNGVKSAKKNIKFRYDNSAFLQQWIPHATFTDGYLEFVNVEGHMLGVKMFGAKTGLRGTKIFGKRPVLCVLDDLVSDDDSKSKVSMEAIKDTVYKGVNHALDPTRRKVIFNGTPFNTDDILIEAVESGAWDVNVWPVCERFPCTREDFCGAWEDRFSFDYIQEQYTMAVQTGKLSSFYQELMLRITSEEERLVQEEEIGWYSRARLLENRHSFNFYTTTDFATSAKQTADDSVISHWAYNHNGDWFWVDGICEKQTMDKTINDLFKGIQEYKPQLVGVEVSGQQGAFINWLQSEMIVRNIWFNFASSEKSGSPGIRPVVDKLSRFNLVVPWFKARKIYFPEEMKQSIIVGKFLEQIRLTTKSGIKGKDDCLDTISQLAYLKPWKPSESAPVLPDEVEIYEYEGREKDHSALDSYIV